MCKRKELSLRKVDCISLYYTLLAERASARIRLMAIAGSGAGELTHRRKPLQGAGAGAGAGHEVGAGIPDPSDIPLIVISGTRIRSPTKLGETCTYCLLLRGNAMV